MNTAEEDMKVIGVKKWREMYRIVEVITHGALLYCPRIKKAKVLLVLNVVSVCFIIGFKLLCCVEGC